MLCLTGLSVFGVSAQLLGRNPHNLTEIPVKGGKSAKAGPGGYGIDGIVCSLQFVAGAADADLVNVFNRRHFHAFHKNPSEMSFAHMTHCGQFFYFNWTFRHKADVVKGGGDDGGICRLWGRDQGRFFSAKPCNIDKQRGQKPF